MPLQAQNNPTVNIDTAVKQFGPFAILGSFLIPIVKIIHSDPQSLSSINLERNIDSRTYYK
jgi:hypothetical protein